ncbi:tail sheath [Staphylococcus phage phiSA_BS1]|uniref:Major tail sheath n=2 Tax=Baoshanvirus TaxID=2732969 RepID=A0A2P1MXH8_9CAUD|nr:tail sheath [Staphylococcus phage phiSA_BS1]YP_009799938.1 tail sheath [Staphylococcus phage phiSA_BS2]AVP40283.1 major tail sheath [Staphylococcus phage phiSA_BS1]AVR55542.1 major tail sheath [Staphylococcus phage phiSA_BS2]WFG34038.1 hypothetical protein F10086_116 [Staphylococcus phage vB_SauM_JDF86]
MAESVFPRIPITRPHTEINVDTSGIGGSASSSEKILCLIGQAEGGEPNTVYELRNYSQAEQVFRSGELVDAIHLAWTTNPEFTAGTILAMRIEDAEPATLTKGGLTFKSKIYGVDSNDIQVALEENTITDSYRLKVNFDKDRIRNTYDNIGNIFKLEYTGEGQGTYTVKHNKETGKATNLILSEDGSEVRNYALGEGVYEYTNDIIKDVNNLPSFKATLSPFGNKDLETKYLDEVTDVDIKVEDGVYVTAVFGDILNQTKYDQAVTIERAEAQQESPSDVGVEAGESSAEVTAGSTVSTQDIEPFELSNLQGGTNGTPPSTWSEKLDKFAHEGGYYIVPLSSRQSVHAEVAHFVTSRSDAGEPMRAIVGAGFNEAKEQLIGRASALVNPRVTLIANSGTFMMGDGRRNHVPAYMVAAAIGGLVSGLDIGESITFKNFGINSLDQVYESSDLDQLNENGVVSIEFVRDRLNTRFRIVDDVTTFNDTRDPVKSEMAIGEENDFLSSELKILLDDNFIGTRTTETSPSIIKDFIQSYLERKKRDHEIQDFTPEDVQVIIEGKEARISMTVFPIRTLKKITVSLVYKEQQLQA